MTLGEQLSDKSTTKTVPLAQLANTPTLVWAILGLSLIFVCLQSMRITTLTGIYPVDWTLLARHLIATLVLLAALNAPRLSASSKDDDRTSVLDSQALFRVCAAALSTALLVKYLPSIIGFDFPLAHNIARLAEEPLEVMLVLLWGREIVRQDRATATAVFGWTILVQSVIQFIMAFLQSIPCMIAFALLPPLSALCKSLYRSSGNSNERENREAGEPPTPVATWYVFVALTLCVFFFSLLSGAILYDSLEVQQATSSSPLMQVCIILGNALAGATIVFGLQRLSVQGELVVLLITAFFCITASLYLSLMLTGKATGLYLCLSSVAIQFSSMLIWSLPYTVQSNDASSWFRFVIGYAAFFFAKCISSALMIMQSWLPGIFGACTILSLFLLFVCLSLALVGLLTKTPTAKKDAFENEDVQTREDGQKALAEDTSEDKTKMNIGTNVPPQTDQHVPVDQTTTKAAILDSASKPSNEAPLLTVDDSFLQAASSISYRDAVAQVAREYDLTRREEDVLARVARGKTAGLIAEEMYVSLNTVKSHMRNLYTKLGVHSQAEVISLVEKFEMKQ